MIHGGDIYRNEVKLDFSVSINPLGPPKAVKDILVKTIAELESYPDIKNENLIKAISKVRDVDPNMIAVGNGSSELFMAIAHGFRPRRILLPVPSFTGYEWIANACGAKVDHFLLKREQGFTLGLELQDMIHPDTDMLILCNPNNPTGTYIDKNILSSIIAKCMENDVIVVLDECFMELSDDPESHSFLDDVKNRKNLIVVRSFTKTYGIPGLRLGYLVGGDIDNVEKIRMNLPEWNVSLPAQFAGIYALKENEYVKKSRETIITERKFLSEELLKTGTEVYPSNAGYLLIYSDKELYWALLRREILIRDCSDFLGLTGGYFRVAVKTRKNNEKLIEAIKGVI